MRRSNFSKEEVDFLVGMIKEKYGKYLSIDELDEIQQDISVLVESADSLRSVNLENSDEPFSIFFPYRSDVNV